MRKEDKMKKLITVDEAVNFIREGDTLLVGGFGLSGTPLTILNEIAKSKKKNLIVVSNSWGI
jgi:3-oxoacid CoA-transferase subunit A